MMDGEQSSPVSSSLYTVLEISEHIYTLVYLDIGSFSSDTFSKYCFVISMSLFYV